MPTPAELFALHGDMAGIDQETLVIAGDDLSATAQTPDGIGVVLEREGDTVTWRYQAPTLWVDLPADPGAVQGAIDLADLLALTGGDATTVYRRLVAMALAMNDDGELNIL